MDGDAIGRATIPTNHVITLLAMLTKVLRRVSRIVEGDTPSVQTRRLSQAIEEELALDLVSLKEGSVAAVLGLERAKEEPTLLGTDFGQEVIEKAIAGLATAQELEPDEVFPDGYNDDVIEAWLDASSMFNKGVNKISFAFNGNDQPLHVNLSNESLQKIRVLRIAPSRREREVEGKLLMVDLGRDRQRLEIYPSVGDPIRCTFDDDLRQVVADNITRFVRVSGIAEEDPKSGDIKTMNARSIEPLDSFRSFWKSASIEELINEQRVKPVNDLSVLYGSWPGESEDGFEEAIDQLRRHQLENDQ